MTPHILIVDDDKSHCEWYKSEIEKILRGRVNVNICSEIRGAKSIISDKDNPIDIVITDMRLPDSLDDGYRLARFIKSRSHRTQIIAMTAKPDYEIGMKCIYAGCIDYIDKGNFDRLFKVVKRTVEYVKSNADKDSLIERLLITEWTEMELEVELEIYQNTKNKGDALENLCYLLFKSIPGWEEIDTNYRSRTEEFDLVINNNSTDRALMEEGLYIPVECKFHSGNGKPGKDEIVTFINKISTRNRNDIRLGFFVSYNGFAETSNIVLDKESGKGFTIVRIDKEKLWDMICAGDRLNWIKDLIKREKLR